MAEYITANVFCMKKAAQCENTIKYCYILEYFRKKHYIVPLS